MRLHLDTGFLVYALSRSGPERQLLLDMADSEAQIEISAVAWYEFSRGPRTPEQLAAARSFFDEDGIIPLSEDLAAEAAERFRRLVSPRRRAADIIIGTTALIRRARLLTRNRRDFAGLAELEILEAGASV